MNDILLFGRWDTSKVTIQDKGLEKYINVRPVVVPRSTGKYATSPFHKNDMTIVERFMNKPPALLSNLRRFQQR